MTEINAWTDVEVAQPGSGTLPPSDDFWDARPVLTHIRTFARARRVAPWAVLGVVLARVVTATPTTVQLPPIIGGYASLNLFVGLVAKSGGGKDAARKVAAAAVDLGEVELWGAPLGSGEGLSHMFMRKARKDEEEPQQYRTAALVMVGEIDTMGALVKRQASTVASQLRQAAMGEALGFHYVDPDKRMIVPEHCYRCCLIAGIQPRRSAVLLDDADGGTPQRFLWLPATDPDRPSPAPEPPEPWRWQAPDWSTAPTQREGGELRTPVRLPRVAEDMVIAAADARLDDAAEADLDGHALLTREKVATALAILDGRTYVTVEDWALSGQVMAVSDATRERCAAALASEQHERNVQMGNAEAVRAVVVREQVAQADVQRAAKSIRSRLAKEGKDGATRSTLRGAMTGESRKQFDAAMDSLLVAGLVIKKEIEYQGQTGERYWLVDHG